MASPGDPWVLRLKEATRTPALRLVCVPYAGGVADLFRTWVSELDDAVELLAIRLPGRGTRIKEPSYTDWAPLLTDVYAAVSGYLREPHAFYGHSFGGRLGYELAALASAEYGRTRHLFVSGCRSPEVPQARPYMHEMSDAEFVAAVRGMGGTPAEVLGDARMVKFLLPALRNDIRLAELWGHEAPARIEVPITAVYGADDPIDNRHEMAGWVRLGAAGSALIGVPGGHFFLDENRADLIGIINERTRLTACLP